MFHRKNADKLVDRKRPILFCQGLRKSECKVGCGFVGRFKQLHSVSPSLAGGGLVWMKRLDYSKRALSMSRTKQNKRENYARIVRESPANAGKMPRESAKELERNRIKQNNIVTVTDTDMDM